MDKYGLNPKQEEKVIKSALPFYIAGGVWLFYALFFDLYRITDFAIVAMLSVLAWFLADRFIPGKKIVVDIPVSPVATGDREVDQIITQGREYLLRIRGANAAIPDRVLTDQINELESISVKIFDHVAQHPKKAPQIRKFMNYYLPTALKLLESYQTMQDQGVRGENIRDTMGKIEDIMGTIIVAFEKQLDSLFKDEALDISSDITVLEGMMAMEGLTGSDPFKK